MTKWTIADMPDQQNRVALVTGANSGIGYEIALALARKGARVILACRNMDKGQAALERIAAQVTNADLDLRRLDLNSLALVHTFADGVCDDGTHTCVPGAVVPDGTSCGTGYVCRAGTCVAGS